MVVVVVVVVVHFIEPLWGIGKDPTKPRNNNRNASNSYENISSQLAKREH